MPLFQNKPQISRQELKETLKKTVDPKLSLQKRMGMEREVFSKKYGGFISKQDYQRAINEQKRLEMSSKDLPSKLKIRERINYLKKILEK